jgi:hypothetical protein
MQRSTLYPIGGAATLALCALIATCRPEPGPQPEATTSTSVGASGAGGAAETAESAAASVASTSAGASEGPREPGGCEVRAPKHTTCENDSDCFDGSQCSQDVCDLAEPHSPPDPYGRRGTCRWTVLADGTPCDVSDGSDSCRSGVCCPPGILPPAEASSAAAAPMMPLPRVK